MTKLRPRVPIGLPIAAIVLLVLGLAAGSGIRAVATPQQMAENVLLSAIPFILIFAAIILAFITVIVVVARALSHNIPQTAYRPIETVIIAGIVLGVVGMFQPWLFVLYKYGFLLLLFSTLAFILWSHVVPKNARQLDEPGAAAAGGAQPHDGLQG